MNASNTQSAPELLMPAGNFEKLKVAFAYGADAVYAGAPQFSLRARENGFKKENMAEAIQYTHDLGKKLYLTANIVAHNRKIKPFMNKIDEMVGWNPDALIMADPGLIDMVKERHPDMEIHLSVQANAMNWATVKFWYKMGVRRIILSRELSIDEVKEIKDNCPEMELEAFVHGAICIAHSGRCLMSNFFSYRDANDGCCNNACRWGYKVHERVDDANESDIMQLGDYTPIKGDFYLEELNRPGQFMRIDEDEFGTYLMNAKDLMAIEYLNEMKAAGIDSFKAEGRTKSIYYLAMTSRAYRSAIDDMMAGKSLDPKDLNDLMKIHNRGYTPGFLINRADHDLQRYEEGITNVYTQEFGAIVEKSEPGKLWIRPRNRLKVGDSIEIITPNQTYETTIQNMTNEEGESLDAIHGGTNVLVWIPFDTIIDGTHALVSRKVENPTTLYESRQKDSTNHVAEVSQK